ncbi:MAG: RcnB family protein [Rhizomicrobium sp.]
MRKFLISAAIVGLIAGTSLATAQDQDHRGGGDNRSHGEPGNGPRAAAPAPPPAATNGRNAIGQREMREHHDTPSVTRAAQPAPQAAPNAMRGNPGRPDNFNRNATGPNFDRNNSIGGNPGRQNDNRSNFNRPNSNNFNNANRGGQRHDFSSFRNFHQNFRADRRFRGPSYRRPPGYYARRWTWGQVLPNFFWTRDYWLTDYYDYDLPPPPFGAIWVRVGDDALLIDQDSGEIIAVEYGIFY